MAGEPKTSAPAAISSAVEVLESKRPRSKHANDTKTSGEDIRALQSEAAEAANPRRGEIRSYIDGIERLVRATPIASLAIVAAVAWAWGVTR